MKDGEPIMQWAYGGFYNPRDKRKALLTVVDGELMWVDQDGAPLAVPTLPKGLDDEDG